MNSERYSDPTAEKAIAHVMSDRDRKFAVWCAANDPLKFYKSTAWKHKRIEVLKMDKYECQICREKYHRYRKATTVHHVNHFRKRPDFALEIWYWDPAKHRKRRNLISLCHDCHEEVHNYRKGDGEQHEALTEERWD